LEPLDNDSLKVALEESRLLLKQLAEAKIQIQEKAQKLLTFNLAILSLTFTIILHFESNSNINLTIPCLVKILAKIPIVEAFGCVISSAILVKTAFLLIVFSLYLGFIFIPIYKIIKPGTNVCSIGMWPHFFGEANRIYRELGSVSMELLQEKQKEIDMQIEQNKALNKKARTSHRATFWINIPLIIFTISLFFLFS
jgi:hypothetical protein